MVNVDPTLGAEIRKRQDALSHRGLDSADKQDGPLRRLGRASESAQVC